MVDRRDEVSRGLPEDYRYAAEVVSEAVIGTGQPRPARLCGRPSADVAMTATDLRRMSTRGPPPRLRRSPPSGQCRDRTTRIRGDGHGLAGQRAVRSRRYRERTADHRSRSARALSRPVRDRLQVRTHGYRLAATRCTTTS